MAIPPRHRRCRDAAASSERRAARHRGCRIARGDWRHRRVDAHPRAESVSGPRPRRRRLLSRRRARAAAGGTTASDGCDPTTLATPPSTTGAPAGAQPPAVAAKRSLTRCWSTREHAAGDNSGRPLRLAHRGPWARAADATPPAARPRRRRRPQRARCPMRRACRRSQLGQTNTSCSAA